jgi:rhodanese-related sulfurtransferase
MLVYCAGGGRSAAACEFLSRSGFENVFNLEGGFMSWSGPTARP